MFAKVCLVIFVGLTAQTCAQVFTSGRCSDYQATPDFDNAFVSKMIEEERAYLFVMSSGPELTCQKVKFLVNGTIVYSFTDINGIEQSYSGRYSVAAYSSGAAGTIKLRGFPITILGTGTNGAVTLKVLVANEEQLVAVSCLNLGGLNVFNIETIAGLVEEERFFIDQNATTQRLKETIGLMDLNRPDQIEVQSQFCGAARGDVLKVFDKLVKFGIIPNIPFLRDIIELILNLLNNTDDSSRSLLYSAPGQVAYPALPNFPQSNIIPGHLGQPHAYFAPTGMVQQTLTCIPTTIPGSQFYQSSQYQPQVVPEIMSFPPPSQNFKSPVQQSAQESKFSIPSDALNSPSGFRTLMQSIQPTTGPLAGSSLYSHLQQASQSLKKHEPSKDPYLSKLLVSDF